MHAAALHGQHGRFTADRLGRRIHADGALVERYRLDVLDDKSVTVVGCEAANGEIRPAIGACGVDETLFLANGNPADETYATRTAKLLIQVVGTTIVL